MRRLRQQQQQKALDALAKLQIDTSSDENSSDESSTPPPRFINKFAAIQVSHSPSDDESSSKSSSSSTSSSVMRPIPKKSKAKSKKQFAVQSEVSSSESDCAELDSYLNNLKEKGEELSTDIPDIDELDKPSFQNTSVLKMSKDNFDINVELKRIFGSNATTNTMDNQGVSERLRGWRAQVANRMKQSTGTRRYWLLPEAAGEWPIVNSGYALIEKEEKDDIDIQSKRSPIFEMTFPSDSCRAFQQEFYMAVASHDPGSLYGLLHRRQFHIDTCLQIAQLQQDPEGSFKFVKMAVHGLQCAIGPLFSPFASDNQGLPRVAMDSRNNRVFFKTLLLYYHGLLGQGCFRSAFEVAKLLFVSDIANDRSHALLLMDFPPIRSKHFSLLHELCSKLLSQIKHILITPPNFSASKPQIDTLDCALPSFALARVLALRLEASTVPNLNAIRMISADRFSFALMKPDSHTSTDLPLSNDPAVAALQLFVLFPHLPRCISEALNSNGASGSTIPTKSPYRSNGASWDAIAATEPFSTCFNRSKARDSVEETRDQVYDDLCLCAASKFVQFLKQEDHLSALHGAASRVIDLWKNSPTDGQILQRFHQRFWRDATSSLDVVRMYGNVRVAELSITEGSVSQVHLPDWLLGQDKNVETFFRDALNTNNRTSDDRLFYQNISSNPLVAFFQTLLPFGQQTDPDAVARQVRDRVRSLIERIRGPGNVQNPDDEELIRETEQLFQDMDPDEIAANLGFMVGGEEDRIIEDSEENEV